MSQPLTVTRVPEEKFRRFSRFPYVAATKIDERYNNVYIKSPSLIPNKKSNLKFLGSTLPGDKSREVTFDFKEKPSNCNKMLGTVPRVSPPPAGQVVLHQVDITEGNELETEVGEVSSKYNSGFAKLKEKFLADSREKERTFETAKKAELSKVQEGKRDWRLISYEPPKVPNSLQEKDNQSVHGIEFCDSKQQKLVDEGEMEDVLNDGVGKGTSSNIGHGKTKVNGGRYGDHTLLELIDFGYPLPNSEDKSLYAVKKPSWLVKNTRFGGDIKITAYRPSTTMDTFRKEKLEAINECCVDVDESKTIWTEVDTIIHHSTNRRKRMNQQLNCVNNIRQQNTTFIPKLTMETDQRTDRNEDLKYAIELRPLLRSTRNGSEISTTKGRIWSEETEMVKRIKHMESKVTDIENMVEKEQDNAEFRKFKPEYFYSEDDLKSGNNARLVSKSSTSSNADVNHTDERKDCLINHQSHIKKKDGAMDAGKIQFNNSGFITSSSRPVTEGECNHKAVTMATTLPRITSSRTPLPTGITQPPPRSHSSASMYVPYPPKELSSSDFLRMPARINPLAPPPPRRRINWSWETMDQHHENEKRSLLMQKREHTRYHSAWSKAFYGAPAEKEAYRRHFREVLKQQMSDKDKMEKMEFKEKIKETEQAISYDRDCRTNDAKEYHRKHVYLMQYRDGNKEQMEDRWADTRYSRELENRIDRERLRYNPINWSCSLK